MTGSSVAHAASDTLDDRRRWLSLAAVVSAAMGAGFSIGLTIPLLSLAIEARGWSATVNGANAAMPAVAVLLLGRSIPSLVARVGTVQTMAMGVLLAAAFLLLFPVLDHIAAWFVLRFGLGYGIAIAWVVSETWINRIATEKTRGRMVATYAALWSAGIACGPQLLRVTGTEGWQPFGAAAGLLALAMLPILLAHRLAPPMAEQESFEARHIGRLWRVAPVALTAAFVGGFAELGAFALFPIWAVAVGIGEDGAVGMLSVFSIGGLLMQLPIGWLADRVDREKLLLACGAVAFLGPALLPVLIDVPILMWPVLFLAGSAVMGFYTLGLTVLGQRFPKEDLAAGNVIFVIAYMAGGIAGPALGGGALDAWRPHGLPALLAALFLAFVVFGLALMWRRR
ncbi:MAG TPA: MFS transporter [Azospirillaceae bacterium]|nr:MFS transporter [Azospirillaceae bacterium]